MTLQDMTLADMIGRRPVAVAMGLRRAGGMSAAAEAQLNARLDALRDAVVFPSRAALAAASPDGATARVETAGHAAPGDGGAAAWVRVGTEPAHPGKVRTADGAWWQIDARAVVPEQFGAAGDGVADDTLAFRDTADYCIRTRRTLHGTEGAEYRLTGPVRFGIDTGGPGMKAAIGHGATILADFANAPILDLTGIENGAKFRLTGWRIETVNSALRPTCAILQARPRLGAGVVSSGNVVIEGNTVYGHFSVACYLNIQSESNTIRANHFFQEHISGFAAVWTRHDYFRDMVCLEWAGASGAFLGGESIAGATSGATARIIRPPHDAGGGAGRAWVHVTGGTFLDGETISGGTSATTAAVDHPGGYDLIGPASPTAALGVEEDSTASLQVVRENFFNIVTGGNADPVVLVSDWIDFDISGGNNFNHSISSPEGVHLAIQQDQTRNPALSTGVTVTEHSNFHHARHRISTAFGDPVSGGGTYGPLVLGPHYSAGNVTDMEARFAYIGQGATANLYDSRIDSDFTLDLRGINCHGANRFRVSDVNYGGFHADQQIEGVLEISSDIMAAGRFTMAMNDGVNRLDVHIVDLGLRSVRRRGSVTLSGGVATVSQPMTLVDTEGGAATDFLDRIELPTGVVAHGQIVGLRALSAARTVTVRPGAAGGNIRSRGNGRLRLDAVHYTFFMAEATSGFWLHLGDVTPGADECLGFTAMTGTPDKGPLDAGTATVGQLAARVVALEAAMLASGVISG